MLTVTPRMLPRNRCRRRAAPGRCGCRRAGRSRRGRSANESRQRAVRPRRRSRGRRGRRARRRPRARGRRRTRRAGCRRRIAGRGRDGRERWPVSRSRALSMTAWTSSGSRRSLEPRRADYVHEQHGRGLELLRRAVALAPGGELVPATARPPWRRRHRRGPRAGPATRQWPIRSAPRSLPCFPSMRCRARAGSLSGVSAPHGHPQQGGSGRPVPG